MSDQGERSDASIIGASLKDGRAFAALFDRHAARIWRYAYRRAGSAVVDEVVAETFERAFAGRDRYDLEHRDAAPWLYGIATNVLRGHVREEERRRRAYVRAAEAQTTDGDLGRVEERLDAATRVPAVGAALAELAPAELETLLLFALADLDYGQIAVALDVPVGTVRSRLYRARQRTRLALEAHQALGLAEAQNERDGQ